MWQGTRRIMENLKMHHLAGRGIHELHVLPPTKTKVLRRMLNIIFFRAEAFVEKILKEKTQFDSHN